MLESKLSVRIEQMRSLLRSIEPKSQPALDVEIMIGIAEDLIFKIDEDWQVINEVYLTPSLLPEECGVCPHRLRLRNLQAIRQPASEALSAVLEVTAPRSQD